MKKQLVRYKVTVLSLKSRRGLSVPDDGIFLMEGDVLGGYGYADHQIDKYFDLWFDSEKEDRDNYVTFGRVKKMEEFRNSKGKFYVTKIGRFIVEEVPSGRSENL